jgi:hypothetical protein
MARLNRFCCPWCRCVYLTVNQTRDRTYSQTEMSCFSSFTINNITQPWVQTDACIHINLQEHSAEILRQCENKETMHTMMIHFLTLFAHFFSFTHPLLSIPWSSHSCVACMNQSNVKPSIARQSACQQICQNPLLINISGGQFPPKIFPSILSNPAYLLLYIYID